MMANALDDIRIPLGIGVVFGLFERERQDTFTRRLPLHDPYDAIGKALADSLGLSYASANR